MQGDSLKFHSCPNIHEHDNSKLRIVKSSACIEFNLQIGDAHTICSLQRVYLRCSQLNFQVSALDHSGHAETAALYPYLCRIRIFRPSLQLRSPCAARHLCTSPCGASSLPSDNSCHNTRCFCSQCKHSKPACTQDVRSADSWDYCKP